MIGEDLDAAEAQLGDRAVGLGERRVDVVHGKARARADEPIRVRTITAGQTARITAGQWLGEQPSDIHQAANRGSSPVVIYLATLLKDGAAPSTPVDLHRHAAP